MSDLNDISELLRALREARGFSQERLGAQSGVGRATVQNIESGKTSPTVETVKAIAGPLGVSPRDLIPGASRPSLEDAAKLVAACEHSTPLLARLALAFLTGNPDDLPKNLPKGVVQAFEALLSAVKKGS